MNNYSGKLKEVVEKNAGIKCEVCASNQMQLVSFLEGDKLYRCRVCKTYKKGLE